MDNLDTFKSKSESVLKFYFIFSFHQQQQLSYVGNFLLNHKFQGTYQK
jgi:hypothetical protein